MKRLRMRISTPEEKRGSFEGAIRIPLRALSFLFNDLAFLRIPRKSLKFLTLLFSIPTAHTVQPIDMNRLPFRVGHDRPQTASYSLRCVTLL